LRTSPSVRKAPVFTLQSGPVAGMLGAEFYSRELLGGQGLICLDIGGTSSDIGIVHDGKATVTNEWQLEHAMPLSITTLDVRSIGSPTRSACRRNSSPRALTASPTRRSPPRSRRWQWRQASTYGTSHCSPTALRARCTASPSLASSA